MELRKSKYRIRTSEEDRGDGDTDTCYDLMEGDKSIFYTYDLWEAKQELRTYRNFERRDWAKEDEANRPRTPEEEEEIRKEEERERAEENKRIFREMHEEAMRNTLLPGEEWAIVSYWDGDQYPEIISRHRTREGAERAFRKRNPWLYRSDDENGRLGTKDCYRPERIEKVEKQRRD